MSIDTLHAFAVVGLGVLILHILYALAQTCPLSFRGASNTLAAILLMRGLLRHMASPWAIG